MYEEAIARLYSTLIYEQRAGLQDYLNKYAPNELKELARAYPKKSEPTVEEIKALAQYVIEMDYKGYPYYLATLDEWLLSDYHKRPYRLSIAKVKDIFEGEEGLITGSEGLVTYCKDYLDRFMSETMEQTIDNLEVGILQEKRHLGRLSYQKLKGDNGKERVYDPNILEKRSNSPKHLSLNFDEINCYYDMISVLRHEYLHAYAYNLGWQYSDGTKDFEQLVRDYKATTSYIKIYQQELYKRRIANIMSGKNKQKFLEGVTFESTEEKDVRWLLLDGERVTKFKTDKKKTTWKYSCPVTTKDLAYQENQRDKLTYTYENLYTLIVTEVAKHLGEFEDNRRNVQILN